MNRESDHWERMSVWDKSAAVYPVEVIKLFYREGESNAG